MFDENNIERTLGEPFDTLEEAISFMKKVNRYQGISLDSLDITRNGRFVTWVM